jgi:hypothetical protein
VKGAQEQFKVMQRATAELKKEQAGIDLGALEDMHEDMQDMLADNEELVSRGGVLKRLAPCVLIQPD